MSSKDLRTAVDKVVRNGNCTGCGGCALLASNIEMELDSDGFMRPVFRKDFVDSSPDMTRVFERMCPGISVTERTDPTLSHHPTFGKYFSSWEGRAIDETVRRTGSSAGVLTALSAWLIDSDKTGRVIGSARDAVRPTRTVPVSITSREDALRSAGSRYAPVANLPLLKTDGADNAFVGKPCEASAAKQLFDMAGVSDESRPIVLSFFCAGTPSQNATEGLIRKLGVEEESVGTLDYRGNGWPGDFRIGLVDGTDREMSYQESWGGHLGRNLQWRCKLCVDGTGGHADIAVGDYWHADAKGFPVFTDAEGTSVVIARTRRGEELLQEAAAAGIVSLSPLDLRKVAAIQPLQVTRKNTLLARLIGRRLGGKAVPRYRGYKLGRLALSDMPNSAKSLLGTYRRTIRRMGPNR
ncbi:coenzyme F420 hydrogenase/dehydrogenase beta subunit domain protein [Pseudarthrobacter chlorophenolicus A6]|uniref:Coenzyme F420 hydrogenase/dehydrogenase beta subunit domain protein n=2 Tax=Pseudarthrobacter chlorophenolicus TaxID=85085 RepID=B8HEG0_PSECP|nr:coenzyme F420 hydrogenase/dehydrogenase beta subunit domain protein [Pseudarthrobacter chlorophenolicus A6]SDQ73127.1 coenzyme F420 hydrogenase subunit beta [Pseudarthrobacter chlorophenolicus]